MNRMKIYFRYLLFVIFLFCVRVSFSQENSIKFYQIINTGNVTDVSPYDAAMIKANWNCYRLMNKRRVLVFDSGLTVELLSAKELFIKGYQVDTSCLTEEQNLSTNQPVYHLDSSGIIVEIHQPWGKPF